MASSDGISVQTLTLIATVLFMMFGGMGTAFELQIVGINSEISDAKQVGAEQRAELSKRVDAVSGRLTALQETLRQDIADTLLPRKEFYEFQKRFESLASEITRLQMEAHAEGLRQAHDPVEKATLQAIDDDFNKRIDLIQTQIVDVNRQIAAALVIIDSNNGIPPKPTAIPP